jgi:hypothetical protein
LRPAVQQIGVGDRVNHRLQGAGHLARDGLRLRRAFTARNRLRRVFDPGLALFTVAFLAVEVAAFFLFLAPAVLRDLRAMGIPPPSLPLGASTLEAETRLRQGVTRVESCPRHC